VGEGGREEGGREGRRRKWIEGEGRVFTVYLVFYPQYFLVDTEWNSFHIALPVLHVVKAQVNEWC